MNQPLLILALLAALSCCQATPAQVGEATTVQSTPGYSQITVSNDNGMVIVMHGPGDEVTVVRDGQVLPGDRVRREGDHLRILDETGATLYDFRTLPGGGLVYPYDAKVGSTTWGGVTAWANVDEPRKIIGVTVDAVDAALASQLDLEPDAGFVIATVSEGLPAEKAGLQPHDVVVKIQGEAPATVERLREVLDGKQPGETVQLQVVRRGQRLDVDVGVAEETMADLYGGYREAGQAYEELARSLTDQSYRQQAEIEAASERLSTLQEELRDAEEALAEAQADSSGDADSRADIEARRADAERVRAELMAQQERLRGSAAEMQLLDLGNGGRALMLPQRSSAYAVAPPALPDDMNDRLRSMEERLTRLEALLEKLVESETAKK